MPARWMYYDERIEIFSESGELLGSGRFLGQGRWPEHSPSAWWGIIQEPSRGLPNLAGKLLELKFQKGRVGRVLCAADVEGSLGRTIRLKGDGPPPEIE